MEARPTESKERDKQNKAALRRVAVDKKCAKARAKADFQIAACAKKDAKDERGDAARASAMAAARAGARAVAEGAPNLAGGEHRKEAARCRRAFLKALSEPEAVTCGLTAAAEAIQHGPPAKKRAARQALAAHWRQFGFDRDRYVDGALPSRQPSPAENCGAAARRAMVVQCKGEASFQRGLASGELEEVRGPTAHELWYRWRIAGPLKADNAESPSPPACAAAEACLAPLRSDAAGG